MSNHVFHRKPLLEVLEDRTLLSFGISFRQGELFLRGSNGPDIAAIHDLGGGYFSIEQEGSEATYSGVKSIKIDAKGGDDQVFYDTPLGIGILTSSFNQFSFKADMGKGNDLFVMDINYEVGDASAAAVQNSIKVYLDVKGGSGSDGIYFSLHNPIPAGIKVNLDLHGGDGSDTVQAVIEPDDFMDGILKIHLDGDDGDDIVTGVFSTPEANVVNNGWTEFHLDGGSGNDLAALRVAEEGSFSLTNNGTFIGTVHGGGGADLINALVGDSGVPIFNTGTLKIQVDGNSGNDTIAVVLGINTGGGNEQTAVISTLSLLNSGLVKMEADGGLGRDEVQTNVAIEGTSDFSRFDGVVKGGINHDVLTFLYEREGIGHSSAKVLGAKKGHVVVV